MVRPTAAASAQGVCLVPPLSCKAASLGLVDGRLLMSPEGDQPLVAHRRILFPCRPFPWLLIAWTLCPSLRLRSQFETAPVGAKKVSEATKQRQHCGPVGLQTIEPISQVAKSRQLVIWGVDGVSTSNHDTALAQPWHSLGK